MASRSHGFFGDDGRLISDRPVQRLGGIRLPDGARWDGVEFLDARVGHNVLLILTAWNDVGVFAVDTERARNTLRIEHGIRTVHRDRSRPSEG